MAAKDVPEQIRHDAECCPNCTQHGSHDLTQGEGTESWEEWRCDNDNCRVLVYFVRTGADPDA